MLRFRPTFLVALGVLCLAVLLGACANNTTPAAPALSATDAWALAPLNEGGNGAVFLHIANTGGAADALIGVTGDVASSIELHETSMDNNVMQMRPVPGQRVEIPAGGEVEFQSGGLHIMLIDLAQSLAVGDRFPLTLKFENAGEQVIEVEVRGMDGMGSMGEGHDMGATP